MFCGKGICKCVLGLLLTASLVVLINCESEESRAEKARVAAQQAEERERIEQEKKAEEERVRAEKLAETAKLIDEANKTVARLKPRFKYEQDKFTKYAWYTHRNYPSYCTTSIRAYICQNPDGYVNLLVRSEYCGSQWLFHKKFIVKIGEIQREYSGERKSGVYSNAEVWENIYVDVDISEYSDAYHALKDDSVSAIDSANKLLAVYDKQREKVNGLVSFIASNPDKTVDVRLEGDRRKDFELSKMHQVAICETWAFFEAIKFLENNSKEKSAH